jgi:hypothetical protein
MFVSSGKNLRIKKYENERLSFRNFIQFTLIINRDTNDQTTECAPGSKSISAQPIKLFRVRFLTYHLAQQHGNNTHFDLVKITRNLIKKREVLHFQITFL